VMQHVQGSRFKVGPPARFKVPGSTTHPDLEL
jgi:hypothetical protein